VRDLGDLSIPSYDVTLSSDDPQNELYRVKYPVVGSRVKYPQIIGKVNYDTFKVIHEEAKNDRFALTLGGDHSVAMGSIAGVLAAKPDTAVIWVDAHADINTPVHSLSGNVHGMAAAFLLKHPECDNIIGYDWLKDVPILPTNRLVYIGLRDLDKHERKTIRAMGIKAFTMHDVDRHGIGKVMEMAMDHVCSRVDRPIHLTLDIDGVDPMFAPSTGTRVGGGLTYREAYYLCEAVADTGLLTSMDIVEVNPTLSSSPNEASRTCQMAVGLVSAALGNRIL
jgi:arginase